MEPYQEEEGMSLGDFWAIFQRRKKSLIFTALSVILLAVVVTLALPPVYRSSAIVLVEAQEIPADFVMTTVTSYVEQRVQGITQRIMSSSQLLEVINSIGLYADIRDKATTEELVEKMQKSMTIKPISVETVDPRTGRPGVATGAVEFSFEGERPGQVQRVTDTIVNNFLQANLKERQRQTSEATTFLQEEMARVKVQLDAAEKRLANFKKKHINALPEMLEVNQQAITNIEHQITRNRDQMRSLRERESYLQAQLASMPEKEDTTQTRLQQLEIELVNLKTKFTDEYPDVRKMKQEIEDLKRQRAQTQSGLEDGGQPDNPAYITLAAQLASTQAEIESFHRQILEMESRVVDLQKRLKQTPQVEETYNALMTERNNTHAKYTDLMGKVMEANVAHGLEKEQKGERFTLIEPARFPERPIRPNRIAILVIGIVLGAGSGIGIAALREFTDTSIHDLDDLVDAGILPVLATIPAIKSKRDLRIVAMRRWGISLGVVVSVIAAVTAFHLLVMDLDVFWIKMMRRLAI
jgi:polysaccharide chain length determinant protein (PEP-CTERM system associated)